MNKTIRQSKEIAILTNEVMKLYPILSKTSEVFQFCYNLMATDIVSNSDFSSIVWQDLTAFSVPKNNEIEFTETRAVSIDDEDYRIVLECYTQRPNIHRVPFAYLTKLVLIYALEKKQSSAKKITVHRTEQGRLMMWVGSLFEENSQKSNSMISKINQLKTDYMEA